jgi:hypothetical protein
LHFDWQNVLWQRVLAFGAIDSTALSAGHHCLLGTTLQSFSYVLHATSKEFFRIVVHEVDVAAIHPASQQNAVRVFRLLCKTVAGPLLYGVVGIRLIAFPICWGSREGHK